MRTINGNRSLSARSGKSTTPTPCCSKTGIKRGPWTPEEDEVLANYVRREGEGRWRTLPNRAGLLRCGKSCRLRWVNYLRPSVKRGPIAPDEEDLILRLHRLLGNRWSLIAGRIPGRTDNEIKNYWNTHLSKKLISQGIDPRTHKPLEIINPSTSIDPVPKQITSGLEQENHEKCVGDSYQKTRNQIFNEQGDNNNGYDLDICLTEDTFSSFLDSLIDENSLFLTQNQQATNPVAVEDQCPSIWEAQVLQSMANFGPGYEQRPCNGQAN